MRKYEKSVINNERIEKTKGFFNLYEEEYKFEMPHIIYPASRYTHVKCKCGNKFRINGYIDSNYLGKSIQFGSNLFTPAGDIRDIYDVNVLRDADSDIYCNSCGLKIEISDSVILNENKYLGSLDNLSGNTIVEPTDMILNKINYFVNDFVDDNGEIFKKHSLSLMMMTAFTSGTNGFPIVNKHALSLIFSFNEKDGFVRYSVKDVNTNKLLYTRNISNVVYGKNLNRYDFSNKSNVLFVLLAKLNDLGYFPKELKERMVIDLGISEVLIENNIYDLEPLNLLDFIILYKFKDLSKELDLESMINTHIFVNTIYYFNDALKLRGKFAKKHNLDQDIVIKLIELRRGNFLNTINKGRESIYFKKQMLELIREAFLITTIGNTDPSKDLLANVDDFLDNKVVQEKLLQNPLLIFGQYSLFIPITKEPSVWIKLLEMNESMMLSNIKINIPSLRAFYSITYMRFISFKEAAFYTSIKPNGDHFSPNNNDTYFREGANEDAVNLSNLKTFDLKNLIDLISVNDIYMNRFIRSDIYLNYIITEGDFDYELYNNFYKIVFQTNHDLSIVEYFNFQNIVQKTYFNNENSEYDSKALNGYMETIKKLPELTVKKDRSIIDIEEITLQEILSIPGFANSSYMYNKLKDDKTRFLLLKNRNHPEVVVLEVLESSLLGTISIKSIVGYHESQNGSALLEAAGFYINYFNFNNFVSEINMIDYNSFEVVKEREGLLEEIETDLSWVTIDEIKDNINTLNNNCAIPVEGGTFVDEYLPF